MLNLWKIINTFTATDFFYMVKFKILHGFQCYSISPILCTYHHHKIFLKSKLLARKVLQTLYGCNKRYSKIDQHLARHLKYNGQCLSSPPPFLCSQIITLFSSSIISTNQDTGLKFQPTVESFYPYSISILEFLLLRFSSHSLSISLTYFSFFYSIYLFNIFSSSYFSRKSRVKVSKTLFGCIFFASRFVALLVYFMYLFGTRFLSQLDLRHQFYLSKMFIMIRKKTINKFIFTLQ